MKFRYKNILEFHEVITFKDRSYFISEYSADGDLYKYTSKEYSIKMKKVWKRLREREIRHLITGITEGLCYLHELSTAHGDLKPQNVLLFCNTKDITRY